MRRSRLDATIYPNLRVQDDIGVGKRVTWASDDHGNHICGTMFRPHHTDSQQEACSITLYYVRAYIYGWDWEKRQDELERGL